MEFMQKNNGGMPQWLSWLIVCFWLGSWSRHLGIESRIRLIAQWRACFWILRRQEKGTENLFAEIVDENFPNLGKETDIQIKDLNHSLKIWRINKI